MDISYSRVQSPLRSTNSSSLGFLLFGIICIIGAVGSLHKSSFFSLINSILGTVGISLLSSAVEWLSGRAKNCVQQSRWLKCFHKVIALTVSAVLYLNTFKVLRKNNFYFGIEKAITNIESRLVSSVKWLDPDFIELQMLSYYSKELKGIHGPIIRMIIGDFKYKVKEAIRHLNRVIATSVSTLQFQLDSSRNVLFLDIWTSGSIICLTLSFLFISLALQRKAIFFSRMFDVFCNLIMHAAADISGVNLFWGMVLYVIVIILTVINEICQPLSQERNEKNDKKDDESEGKKMTTILTTRKIKGREHLPQTA